MAKYQTFEQYLKGEKIIRYHDFFKRYWKFATEAAEEKFNSTAQSGPTNTTQAEILLLRVTHHLDEIKFGCLHGLKADLKRYSAKHSSMR